jgi:hypothetical protein
MVKHINERFGSWGNIITDVTTSNARDTEESDRETYVSYITVDYMILWLLLCFLLPVPSSSSSPSLSQHQGHSRDIAALALAKSQGLDFDWA